MPDATFCTWYAETLTILEYIPEIAPLKTKVFELGNGRYHNLSDLAQAMGISASYIYRVRRSERRISEKFIVETMKAFPEYGFGDLFYFVSEDEQLSTRRRSNE